MAERAPAAASAPARKPEPFAMQRRSPDAAPAKSAAVVALIAELDGRPVAAWRERIEALRKEGRTADAEALVAEFARRFPDEPLPAPLR